MRIHRYLVIMLVAAGVSGAAATAASAYRGATKSQARAIKAAERQSPDGWENPYHIYISTVRPSFATACIDAPGSSGWVMGRSYVYRHNQWTWLGSFNTGNISSGSAQSEYWTGPVAVYNDLQRAIVHCASGLGASF
jgi:hypothetical protein